MDRKKLWTSLTVMALLAGVVYFAVTLMTHGTLGLGQLQLPGVSAPEGARQTYTILPPPELPQTPPDLVGEVVEVKDNSLIVRASPDQNGPLSEIVITDDTKLYEDLTKKLGGMGSLTADANG